MAYRDRIFGGRLLLCGRLFGSLHRCRLLFGELPAKLERIGTDTRRGPSTVPRLAPRDRVVHLRLASSAASALSASCFAAAAAAASCNAALTMSDLFTSENVGRRRVVSDLIARSSSSVSRMVTRLPVSFAVMVIPLLVMVGLVLRCLPKKVDRQRRVFFFTRYLGGVKSLAC